MMNGTAIGQLPAGTLRLVNLARVAPQAGVTDGGHPAAVVANRENRSQASLMRLGTVAGDSLAGGDQTQAGRVGNQAVVAVDGTRLENLARAEAADGTRPVDGARLENLVRVDLVAGEYSTHGVQDHGTGERKAERARAERARDRNLNLPRVVDIGFG